MLSRSNIYHQFLTSKGQIAVLIDPEKTNDRKELKKIVEKSEFAGIDYLFIGGSTVNKNDFKTVISNLKSLTKIPLVIFPGDHQQISKEADALLYLSLISGRNPEYLIGQHVKSAQEVFNLGIEVIPTGYVLIDGGHASSVAYVSQTTPIPNNNTTIALNTALAGVLQGKKVIYYDAGSGALQSVPSELIKEFTTKVDTVTIVGGGINSVNQLQNFKDAGAHIIVLGTKIEKDIDFLLDIKNWKVKSHSTMTGSK